MSEVSKSRFWTTRPAIAALVIAFGVAAALPAAAQQVHSTTHHNNGHSGVNNAVGIGLLVGVGALLAAQSANEQTPACATQADWGGEPKFRVFAVYKLDASGKKFADKRLDQARQWDDLADAADQNAAGSAGAADRASWQDSSARYRQNARRARADAAMVKKVLVALQLIEMRYSEMRMNDGRCVVTYQESCSAVSWSSGNNTAYRNHYWKVDDTQARSGCGTPKVHRAMTPDEAGIAAVRKLAAAAASDSVDRATADAQLDQHAQNGITGA